MNKKNLILSIAMGLLLANGAFAGDPKTEKDEKVMNSVTYIEDDANFELDFNTSDYLPEGFDPFEIFVDLDSVIFIEDEKEDDFSAQRYLPANFNAYSYPTDVESLNYIDENDFIETDFDTRKHLPEGFNPYISSGK